MPGKNGRYRMILPEMGSSAFERCLLDASSLIVLSQLE